MSKELHIIVLDWHPPAKNTAMLKKLDSHSRFELDIATSNKLKTEEGQNSQNYTQKTLDWASTYVTH